jgi:hypothetical protein
MTHEMLALEKLSEGQSRAISAQGLLKSRTLEHSSDRLRLYDVQHFLNTIQRPAGCDDCSRQSAQFERTSG